MTDLMKRCAKGLLTFLIAAMALSVHAGPIGIFEYSAFILVTVSH